MIAREVEMAAIRFSAANKIYPGGHVAVSDLDLELSGARILLPPKAAPASRSVSGSTSSGCASSTP